MRDKPEQICKMAKGLKGGHKHSHLDYGDAFVYVTCRRCKEKVCKRHQISRVCGECRMARGEFYRGKEPTHAHRVTGELVTVDWESEAGYAKKLVARSADPTCSGGPRGGYSTVKELEVSWRPGGPGWFERLAEELGLDKKKARILKKALKAQGVSTEEKGVGSKQPGD